jgi:tetratricopeptide (TPR) repeat protein
MKNQFEESEKYSWMEWAVLLLTAIPAIYTIIQFIQLLQGDTSGVIYLLISLGILIVLLSVSWLIFRKRNKIKRKNGQEVLIKEELPDDYHVIQQRFNVSQNNFNQGQINLEHGNFHESIIDFYNVLSHDPQNVDAILQMGLSFAGLGEYDNAIDCYDKTIINYPKDGRLYYYRGIARFRKQEWGIAAAEFTKAILLGFSERDVYAFRGLAYMLMEKRQLTAAISDFDRFISMGGNEPTIYFYRGLAHLETGDFTKAIVDNTQAIHLDPTNLDSYINRAGAYEKRGGIQDHEKALSDLNQVIQLDPNNSLGYRWLGVFYLHKGELDNAIKEFIQAIELAPNDSIVNRELGKAYLGKGGPEFLSKSIASFSKAIDLNPKDDWAYSGLGMAYSQQKDYDRAINALTKAIDLNPKESFHYFYRGFAYFRRNDSDKNATEDLNKASQLNPDPRIIGDIEKTLLSIKKREIRR